MEIALEILFERYRGRGELAALEEVFERTAPELLKVALHLAPEAAAAEDLVQATFLKALENAAKFDARRALVPWLAEKAQDIRDAMTVGEDVAKKDMNWLKKYDESLLTPMVVAEAVEATVRVEMTTAEADQDDDDESDELPFYSEADDSGDEPEASGELV